MHSYATARTYFGFLQFMASIIVVVGAALLFVGLISSQATRGFGSFGFFAGYAGVILGLLLIFFGLGGVVIAQVGRAGVDTAEMTRTLVDLSQKQLQAAQALAAGSGFQRMHDDLAAGPGAAQSRSRQAENNTTRADAVAQTSVNVQATASGLTEASGEPTRQTIQQERKAQYASLMGLTRPDLQPVTEKRDDGTAVVGGQKFETGEAARKHLDGSG
ncbi:hypothetical protein CSC94_18985 [Zhengella mangrovi]|uniref:Uncharacterized protein n=1 Tax=Zhengella mangrovi TaxID=1982044 RepID=A0A2G1QIU6_9HYPH|nr:hypothetical protein [Zhengella mangrovi]PHP65446.1 hypothetical protein CSC94_18985 [Zhengella mangrovi]